MPRLLTKGSSKRAYKHNSGTITARQCAEHYGKRLRGKGLKHGRYVEAPEGGNLDNFASVMRGAGYAIRKEALRKSRGGR